MPFFSLIVIGLFFILIWVLSVDYPVVVNEKYPMYPRNKPRNRTVKAGVWNQANVNQPPFDRRIIIRNRTFEVGVWS